MKGLCKLRVFEHPSWSAVQSRTFEGGAHSDKAYAKQAWYNTLEEKNQGPLDKLVSAPQRTINLTSFTKLGQSFLSHNKNID